MKVFNFSKVSALLQKMSYSTVIFLRLQKEFLITHFKEHIPLATMYYCHGSFISQGSFISETFLLLSIKFNFYSGLI